jgi:HEAT repeat protein
LDVASDSDPELALAAKSAIGKLPGVSVDKEIINRLSHADARSRPVLFDVAARRGIESATPTMLHYADNPDAASRRAALAAVGNIGGDRDAAALVAILESQQDPGRREDTEKALLAIASRRGSSCASILLPLARNPDPDLRLVGLRTLAAAGGPDALAVVRSAIDDKDENVREEAVQTLASWPNTWPEDAQVADPLLALAQTAEKPAHQILALRGYLQFLLGDDKLKAGERFRLLNKSLPLLTRPEEKRLAIAVARQIPTSESLDLLVKFAAEPAVAEDAGSAIIAVATKPKSELSKSVRRQALQGVIDRPATDALKQKAQDVLAKLN